ncbi:MAG: hypothetical protein ACE5FA_01085 [Dehalococcoidia bacterium]
MTLNGTLKATTFWALFAIVASLIGVLFTAQSDTSGDVRELSVQVETHATQEGHPGVLATVRANRESLIVLQQDVKHLGAEVKDARAEQSAALAEILERLPAR